ncbi:MAG: hypothetical protein NUV47_02410 [Patescibacteria group bacterium]|nr:hypothetical protein [Patescibacteria group bacterium]
MKINRGIRIPESKGELLDEINAEVVHTRALSAHTADTLKLLNDKELKTIRDMLYELEYTTRQFLAPYYVD